MMKQKSSTRGAQISSYFLEGTRTTGVTSFILINIAQLIFLDELLRVLIVNNICKILVMRTSNLFT